eukprot:TRINITY_DN2621_c0_g1_i2.p2 TRINITY_DN2621_c0_g1~~TRINITY_DN2621_c0_g1_i2.p2  ORF type:complete len:136 (+),score=53.53 TRINITY_DN2621_c0_g1_i2:100-507(+)
MEIMMSMRNMEGMSLRRERLNQAMQEGVMADMVATVEDMEEVMVVDIVEDMVVTMAKDLLNLDMDMVGGLGHTVAMVVDVEVMVEDLLHMVAMEVAMEDMVEVIMERERLDMGAMEADMVEAMDLAMEAMVEAIL